MALRDDLKTLANVAGSARHKARHYRYMERWYRGSGLDELADDAKASAEDYEAIAGDAAKAGRQRIRRGE